MPILIKNVKLRKTREHDGTYVHAVDAITNVRETQAEVLRRYRLFQQQNKESAELRRHIEMLETVIAYLSDAIEYDGEEVRKTFDLVEFFASPVKQYYKGNTEADGTGIGFRYEDETGEVYVRVDHVANAIARTFPQEVLSHLRSDRCIEIVIRNLYNLRDFIIDNAPRDEDEKA